MSFESLNLHAQVLRAITDAGYDTATEVQSRAIPLALEGAEALCARGVLPVYSLYWPVGGRDHPEYMSRLRNYFERLNLGYHGLRQKYDLHISDSFMTHRCAFMQMECDMDRLAAA